MLWRGIYRPLQRRCCVDCCLLMAALMAANWRPRTDLNRHDQVRSLTSYPLDDEGQGERRNIFNR